MPEFFHKSICIVLNQLWLCPKTCQNQRLVIQGSGKMAICVQSRLFGDNFNAVWGSFEWSEVLLTAGQRQVTFGTTCLVIGTSLTVISVNLMNVLGNRRSPYEIAHLVAIHTGGKLFPLDMKHLYLNDKTNPTNVVFSPAICLGTSMKWRNHINWCLCNNPIFSMGGFFTL